MVTYGILINIIVMMAIALFFSVKRNLELDDRFDELGDQVEESLDILDDCYQRIAKVTEIPVTSDDPVIQQLLSDIKYTKHAILLVANKVVTFDRTEDDEQE
jgi:hypothetical protein